MPRVAKAYWHPASKAWVSNVGPRNEKGRRKPETFHFPHTRAGEKLAQAALAEYLRDRDRREAAAVRDSANPRVWEGVIEPYLAELTRRVGDEEMEMRTLVSHAERIKRFADFVPTKGPHAGMPLRDRLVRSLTDDDIAWLVAGMKAKSLRRDSEDGGCGPNRIRGVLRTVKACFNWAASDIPGRTPRRIIDRDPFAEVKVGKYQRRMRRLPSRGEVARFLRAARAKAEAWKPISGRCGGCVRAKRKGSRCRRSHNRRAAYDRVVLVLCRLQFHAGARPDELCRATWDDVYLPESDHVVPGWEPRAWCDPATRQWWGRITIFAKTTRRTNLLRMIPVPPLLVRSIERLRRAGLHPRLIFPRLTRGGDGQWDSTALASKIRPWRDAAGLGRHFVLYGMRHRMYTIAVHSADLSADRAGSVGGSSGQTVRENYLHADDRDVFEAARRIASAARPPKSDGPPERGPDQG